MAIRGIHHVALSVPDLDRARSFYVDLLGFEAVFQNGWRDAPLVDRVMGVRDSAGRAMLVKAGNLYLELFEFERPAPPPIDPAPPVQRFGYTHIALDVTDIDSVYRRLRESGLEFTCPPQASYGVRTTYGRDPFGNWIELQQIDDDESMPRL